MKAALFGIATLCLQCKAVSRDGRPCCCGCNAGREALACGKPSGRSLSGLFTLCVLQLSKLLFHRGASLRFSFVPRDLPLCRFAETRFETGSKILLNKVSSCSGTFAKAQNAKRAKVNTLTHKHKHGRSSRSELSRGALIKR